MTYIETLPPGQEPPSYAWSACIAPIDVSSNDGRRLDNEIEVRLFDVTTPLSQRFARGVPLFDHTMGVVGIVEHVSRHGGWVYAFGFVHNPDLATMMRDGTAMPEMSITGQNLVRMEDDGLTAIFTGIAYLKSLLTVPLTVRRPIWEGVRFTVQEQPS
jgi:hypothetical protein